MVTNFLIKEGEKPTSPAARERVGKFSGALGIALNTLLAAGKIAVGALFGMISVLADGMNRRHEQPDRLREQRRFRHRL